MEVNKKIETFETAKKKKMLKPKTTQTNGEVDELEQSSNGAAFVLWTRLFALVSSNWQ